jgi:hypothetical protein
MTVLTSLNASTVRTSLAAANLALECEKEDRTRQHTSNSTTTATEQKVASSSEEQDHDLDDDLRHHEPPPPFPSHSTRSTVTFEKEQPQQHDNPDDDGDDDNQIMPFDAEDIVDDVDNDDDASDNDDDDDDIKDKPYVFTPARLYHPDAAQPITTSLPVLFINLFKLCGYLPSSVEEFTEIQHSLETSLLGQHNQDNENAGAVDTDTTNTSTIGDGLSMDFAARSAELLEMGTALHADTSCCCISTSTGSGDGSSSSPPLRFDPANFQTYLQQKVLPATPTANAATMMTQTDTSISAFCVIPYPEYLCQGGQGGQGGGTLISTAQMWSILHVPHVVAVVTRLFAHLIVCNQPLVWKHDIYKSIHHLAFEEEQTRLNARKFALLKQWKTTERKMRLEKLYEVRELMEKQLEETSQKAGMLKQERYAAVQELLEQRSGGGVTGTASTKADVDSIGLDLAKETFGFLDDAAAAAVTIAGNGAGGEDSSEHDSYESSDDNGDADGEDAPAPSRQRHARRKQALKDKKKNAAADMNKERVDRQQRMKRQLERDGLLEQHVSAEETMALTLEQQLQSRLLTTDELLETLQDEEWAD